LYAFIGAGASAFSPTLIGWAIDDLTVGVQASRLALYALGLIALSITLAVFRYQLRMLTGKLAAGITYRMSQDLFNRLLLFDKETREQYGNGDLLSRATSDFIYIWRFYSSGFQMSIHSLFLLLIGSLLMAVTSPFLAGLVAVMLVISILIQVRLGRILERSFSKVQQEMANLSEFIQEHLRSARMLTAYAQEELVGAAFKEANKDYVQYYLDFVLRSGAISPLPSLIVRISTTLVIAIGGLLIMQDQLTMGQYVQFIVYLALLNAGAQQITGAFERLQQGSAAAGRIGEVLHRWPKISDAPDAVKAPLSGHICLENVSIKAQDQDRWVLRNINLDIPAGSTLGIVGATGSGKSMLLSLLGRIHDPDEGTVSIDGHDIRRLKLTTLREAVVYVPQETLLFSMPLRNNIALGLSGTSDEEIHQAMKKARLSNDLPQLPRGLDSVVGEGGATLSGGQRQRTSLARALVRDPKVLLLDDALASVDTKTSAEIIAELRQAREKRTCIIVSQRLAAVQDADRIIVLDEGRIIEQGTRESLLDLNEEYAKMYWREMLQTEEEVTYA
jgi:ATP-binding cassette subfamily B protein